MSVSGVGPRSFDIPELEPAEAAAEPAPAASATASRTRTRTSAASGGDVYSLAQKVAAGDTAFLRGLDAAAKQKLAGTLETALQQGARSTRESPGVEHAGAVRADGRGAAAEPPGGRRPSPTGGGSPESTRQPPSQTDLRARSGAATVALAFAKSLPAADPLRARLLAAYVKQMRGETWKGLQASMAVNLEASGLALDAAQKKDLAAAKAKTMPTAPPYGEWFKNDGRLDVKHYVHPERWEIYTGGYERMGFKKTVVSREHWVYEKTYTDPSGRTPPTPVRVECRKTEKDTFRDMDDRGVEIELYSGHSNLGGNVLGALSEAPREQQGAKWVINWMCRGKQVAGDVANRFPDAHYMTTDVAVNAYDGPQALGAVFDGIARRESYRFMDRKAALDTQLIFPDDPRLLLARDEDRDGVATVRPGEVDPLYDVAPVKDRQGDKVRKGVAFFNTLFTYHHEHGPDGKTSAAAADKVHPAGFFDGAASELVKVSTRKVGSETHYDVKVNRRAQASEQEIGAAIAYEMNKRLSIDHHGSYTEQDKLRGGMFAGLYVAYMVDTLEDAEGTIDKARARYGFPAKFTWANVEKAIDADDHGYGSATSQAALKRKIGAVDPRKG